MKIIKITLILFILIISQQGYSSSISVERCDGTLPDGKFKNTTSPICNQYNELKQENSGELKYDTYEGPLLFLNCDPATSTSSWKDLTECREYDKSDLRGGVMLDRDLYLFDKESTTIDPMNEFNIIIGPSLSMYGKGRFNNMNEYITEMASANYDAVAKLREAVDIQKQYEKDDANIVKKCSDGNNTWWCDVDTALDEACQSNPNNKYCTN